MERSKDDDEKKLEGLARRLLSTPHKPRDESNPVKPTAKAKVSLKAKKKPSR